jgi:hypothetical protein
MALLSIRKGFSSIGKRPFAATRGSVDSFSSATFLPHSLEELLERFRARFLLRMRSTHETVASFAVRGWFVKPTPRKNPNLLPTDREEEPRHFLARNIPPHGDVFDHWTRQTQIGRLASYWQARNRDTLVQFRRLPASHSRVERLEDLGVPRYQGITEFMGWRIIAREERVSHDKHFKSGDNREAI